MSVTFSIEGQISRIKLSLNENLKEQNVLERVNETQPCSIRKKRNYVIGKKQDEI